MSRLLIFAQFRFADQRLIFHLLSSSTLKDGFLSFEKVGPRVLLSMSTFAGPESELEDKSSPVCSWILLLFADGSHKCHQSLLVSAEKCLSTDRWFFF